MFTDFLKNSFLYGDKYRTNSEAVIITCYFNPQKSPYRTKAFNTFYESIKHLNHRVIECVIGDSTPELEESEFIKRVYTENLLWHKESLLNNIIADLPAKFKYVFWVDADVIFTNLNWLTESVNLLKGPANIVQPFEYCIHMEKDELKPSFDTNNGIFTYFNPNKYNKNVWRSFCSNYVDNDLWTDENYDNHGHVGFAWGAKRELLDKVPLYDKALIGGADHIMAHAAAGQIPHICITKSFTDNIDEINDWSRKFFDVMQGKIGYVEGNLFHIWHGDLKKRQYYRRIKEFTKETLNITERDENGLFITKKGNHPYMDDYYQHRETTEDDDTFLTSMTMGYAMNNGVAGGLIGGNLLGGIVGDMLNNDNQPIQNDDPSGSSFGGGESGGGGATTQWDENFS